MKLLAVMSHKGGVGKTTSAVVLAEELAAKGYRTLLVDADRQQGAGLLLEVGTPTGEIQPKRVPGLDYLGSGRFSEAEVVAKAAQANDRYDIGIVDTPSVDDDLARCWLQQATATLMIMQVEPLTVKTFPSALTTLETVRRMNPLIELIGLLPTMFDASEQTHRTCLTELLTRRPESVFTPPVPSDAGLMHRGAGAGAPEISAAARQAYQCAADRIIRVLAPSRGGAAAGGFPAAAPALGPAGGPFSANGTGAHAPAAPGGWQPAGPAPVPPPTPAAPAPPGWPAAPSPGEVAGAAPAAGGFPAPPGSEAVYAVPAGAGTPPAPAGFPPPAGPPAGIGADRSAPAAAFPPAPAAAPIGHPPGSYPVPAPHAGWPAPAAPPSVYDADEREPDWYRSEQTAPAALSGGRGARRWSALPFVMGFAAACVLALLLWAFGAIRKPSALPAHATPPPAAAPGGAAPGAAPAAAPKAPDAKRETKTGAAPRAAVRKEA